MAKNKDFYKDGLYVVIEGMDGTGKTTLSKSLREFFNRLGKEVVNTKEPTDGYYGQMLRRIMYEVKNPDNKKMIDLFLKDRKQHMKSVVRPSIKDNKVIIQDRNFISNVVYQSSTEEEMNYILKENNFAVKPDLIILLDCSPMTSMSRIVLRGEEQTVFETEEKLKNIRNKYNKMFEYINEKDGNIYKINSENSSQYIFESCLSKINNYLLKIKDK